MTLSIVNRAKLACLAAGAIWGLFWIPLRAIGDAGVHSVWATAVFFMVPALFALPVFVMNWPRIRRAGLPFQITIAVSGGALTLYSTSIMFTDVVRALMLFYMMPVWSILLGYFVLGEKITLVRLLAISLALVGMMIMFGLGIRFPIPQNTGDWMGLVAGGLWAATMVRVRSHPEHSVGDMTAGFFLWGAILAVVVALIVSPEGLSSATKAATVLPMLALFMVFLAIPATFASLWGPKFLNPGVAGLMFVPEVVIGAVSAALLAGEAFGGREAIGVTLIIAASLMETISSLAHKNETNTEH
ncbi:DMT family transporter [Roseobacteraceae bacterium S113]